MHSSVQVVDYVVLFGTVVLSAIAGLYYGVYKRKNNSTDEYFLASRELSTFKMACSCFATVISSGTMIGFVAEIYYYGTQISLGFLTFFIAVFINVNFFFPMIFSIGSFNLYQYYELRFNKCLMYALSIIAVVDKTLVCSIVIFAASTVLNQIINMNIWIIISVVTVTCMIYSSVGGVRAVTLADTIQAVIIILAILMVVVFGFICVGDMGSFWNRNWKSGRIEFFNFEFSFITRHTFWSSTIALLITNLSGVTTNFNAILRVMATDSFKSSIKATWLSIAMIVFFDVVCGIIGLLIYSLHYDCDPYASGKITNANQLLAYFVNEVVPPNYGFVGFFYAGILCAALSTLSSTFNGLAALSVEALTELFKLTPSDKTHTRMAKIFVLVIGSCSLLGIIVVQNFPNVLQAAVILNFGIGPQFTLLLIGVLFPQAKVKTAIASFSVGIIFTLWLLIGNVLIKPTGMIKPISTIGCAAVESILNGTSTSILGNVTTPTYQVGISKISNTTSIDWKVYFPLSVVSFPWCTTMGVLTTLITFFLLTLLFGTEKNDVIDFKLIPIQVQTFHKKLNRKWRKVFLCDIYNDDETIIISAQSEKLLNNGI